MEYEDGECHGRSRPERLRYIKEVEQKKNSNRFAVCPMMYLHLKESSVGK